MKLIGFAKYYDIWKEKHSSGTNNEDYNCRKMQIYDFISAQQFKSAVDYSLHENTGLHITAKVGLSELSSMPYNIFDQSTKMNIVRLNKGELVMVHSAFRHPIKITFPNAWIETK